MLLHEQHNGHIRWHDTNQDILILSVEDFGTWDEVHYAVDLMNHYIRSQPHDVYTIYVYENQSFSLPHDNVLANIARLLRQYVENESLIIVVNSPTLKGIIQIASIAYGLLPLTNKFRYADTLEDALVLIEVHRRERAAHA